MSQRRDILKYLGLGIVGAGVATAVGQKFQPAEFNARTCMSVSTDIVAKLWNLCNVA